METNMEITIDYDETKTDPKTNNNFLHFMREDGYWMHNKDLCLVFGNTASMWLTYLMSHGGHMVAKGKILEGSLFYCDQKRIAWRTGISLDVQTQLIKEFIGLGVLQVERRKSPPQNHYGINVELLSALVITLMQIDNEIMKENERIWSINKELKAEDRTEYEIPKFYLIKEIAKFEREEWRKTKNNKESQRPVFPGFKNSKALSFYINKKLLNKIFSAKTENNVTGATHPDDIHQIPDNHDQSVALIRRRPTKSLSEKKQPKTRTNPFTSVIDDVIAYWNQTPSVRKITIPKNGNPPKGPYRKVTKQILPRLLNDGWTMTKIKKSIKVYSSLLSDNFNYRLEDYSGHRVGLDEFLNGFTNDTKLRVKKYPHNVVKPNTVWLKECLKSDDYLDTTYAKFIPDHNPEFTREFKRFLLDPYSASTHNNISGYADHETPEINFKELPIIREKGFSPEHTNLLTVAAKRVQEFIDTYQLSKKGCPIRWMNDVPLAGMVQVVFRSISRSISSGWNISMYSLIDTKTYEERIPKMFKYSGELRQDFVPLEMPWKDGMETHG
jgi:hypothetical protein